jgi:hypothetical protein
MKKGFFTHLTIPVLLPMLLGAAQTNIQITRAYATPPIFSLATVKLIASYTPAATALTYMGSHYKELKQPYRASTATMQHIQWGCFVTCVCIIIGYLIYLHKKINRAAFLNNWTMRTTADNTQTIGKLQTGIYSRLDKQDHLIQNGHEALPPRIRNKIKPIDPEQFNPEIEEQDLAELIANDLTLDPRNMQQIDNFSAELEERIRQIIRQKQQNAQRAEAKKNAGAAPKV